MNSLLPHPKTVLILGFEGCLPSGIVGLVDMFWLANQANAETSPVRAQSNASYAGSAPSLCGTPPVEAAPQFKVITASFNGKALRDGMGRSIAVDAHVLDVTDCDAVLIPGLIRGASGLPSAADLAPVSDWLRLRHQHGNLLAGSCVGVFVLGEAGLLDQRRCTTTWWLHDELTRRYPKAKAEWGAALLEDRGIVSVGGPMSWVDMALHTIRRLGGADAAKRAADFAVIDNTALTQALYAPKRYFNHFNHLNHVNHVDALLVKAEQAVRQAPLEMSATQLAKQLAMSDRTLHRRLTTLTGEAPKAFITRTRLEMAKTLLDSPGASIKRTAQQCGYADEGNFRRAFNRFAGMSPSAYKLWVKERAS